MTTSNNPRLRRAPRKERGIAVVEMALLLPLLILMLFGTVHFAGLFFLQNNMVNAARDAARRLAVEEMTQGQAETFIEEQLDAWPAEFTITIDMPDPLNPLDRDIEVDILVAIADASLIDFIGGLQEGNLNAHVVMRKE